VKVYIVPGVQTPTSPKLPTDTDVRLILFSKVQSLGTARVCIGTSIQMHSSLECYQMVETRRLPLLAMEA
jgi:hypothetical protein